MEIVMTDIVVNDIDPRIQFTAAGGQTVFAYPFPIFNAADLQVYRTPAGTVANDVAQILVLTTNYTVIINAAPAVGGSVTLNVAANAGDIITIIRNMAQNRLINYLDGGQWSATQFNTDFDRTVLMSQTDRMFARDVTPHYNNSAVIANGGYDFNTVLPLLAPLTSWRMNAAGTGIEAFAPQGGGGGGIGAILPTTLYALARFNDTMGTVANSTIVQNAAGTITSVFSTLVVGGDVLTNNLQVNNIPGKNLLINGDMQVWQRGAGGTAVIAVAQNANTYTADRWQIITGANEASTVTQLAGPTSGSFLCTVQRNAGQNGNTSYFFGQSLVIDSCIGVAGNQMTLSFKAKAGANYSSAANALGVRIRTGTGAVNVSGLGGAFTGNVILYDAPVTLTLATQSFTITTPAAAANVTQVCVEFYFIPTGVAGADDSFSITDVQLELSPYKTQFQRLGFQETLLKCLPYYQKSFQYITVPGQGVGVNTGENIFMCTVAGANAQSAPTINFQRTMRVSPINVGDIVTFSPGAATNQVYDETAAAACTNIALANISRNGFYVTLTGNAGSAVGNVMGLHWTAQVEL